MDWVIFPLLNLKNPQQPLYLRMQLAMQSAEQTFRILKTKQFRVGVFSSIFQQLESKSTTHFLAAKKYSSFNSGCAFITFSLLLKRIRKPIWQQKKLTTRHAILTSKLFIFSASHTTLWLPHPISKNRKFLLKWWEFCARMALSWMCKSIRNNRKMISCEKIEFLAKFKKLKQQRWHEKCEVKNFRKRASASCVKKRSERERKPRFTTTKEMMNLNACFQF